MREDGSKDGNVVLERSVAYAISIIHLFRDLERDSVGRILGNQLLRAGTSIGANVHEAQAAQSRPDFISKLSIAHKEAREAAYWLRLLEGAGVAQSSEISRLTDETDQLVRLLSSIILSAKGIPRRNS